MHATDTSTAGRRGALRRAVPLLPGLLVAAAGAALAYLVHLAVPGLNPGSAAVALGVLAVNLGLIRPVLQPGLKIASRTLLRTAVVLLGLQLSFRQLGELGSAGLIVVVVTVGVTFVTTRWLGRLLGLDRPLSLLIATGFSICGASAIAAMEPFAKGRKHDTAVAVALVTLCGSLAIVILPLLQHPLGLDDPVAFGSWVGASVHDVGQTVATANQVPGALQSAVIVKLTRVIMLAPLVFAVAVSVRRVAARLSSGTAQSSPVEPGRRPPLMPLFVLGFLLAIIANSVFSIPAGALQAAKTAQEILLAVALFGLGTGVSWQVLRKAGGKPLLLGLISWVIIAAVAYAGVRLTH
ncbi:YeiH family protein [Nakamurella lactea]|uniref:YeiH family protein n=1 Tax=Nakamurella lactea TaxID=459515 RepID=UPI000429786C|nr:putative sulfate exporter family transporter [Nakamurella lactea]